MQMRWELRLVGGRSGHRAPEAGRVARRASDLQEIGQLRERDTGSGTIHSSGVSRPRLATAQLANRGQGFNRSEGQRRAAVRENVTRDSPHAASEVSTRRSVHAARAAMLFLTGNGPAMRAAAADEALQVH